MTDPPLSGRRLRTARAAGVAPEPAAPPVPSARELARIRCPRCQGAVDLQPLQTWDPYRLLLLCRDPGCGRIHLRTPGDGARRHAYTAELSIPTLGELGLEPVLPPTPDEVSIAAREILAYSPARG